MREAIFRQLSGTAQQVELPPPFGGLNTRDDLAAMQPQDAVTFTNLVSEPSGVFSRNGYEDFTTTG